MPLRQIREPFDHPDFIFELKYDGFRALAILSRGTCKLVSRKGHHYRAFDAVAAELLDAVPCDAVLDGELVCLDADGRPRFYDLLRHRGTPHFAAFDLLSIDGRDLTSQTLLQRKALLRRLLPPGGPVLYVNHVEGSGRALYNRVCEWDLEGIVGKWKHGAYSAGEKTSWVKVKNPGYSQAAGRADLFQKRR
jgi:bifunctional non-homologous end joining protein LigD